MSLTKPQKCGTIDVSKPQTLGEKVPLYKVQREYTNWEEITVEAESEEVALDVMEDDSLWEYAIDASTYNYTGETWIGLADE
jgi:hypothetical protein